MTIKDILKAKEVPLGVGIMILYPLVSSSRSE